MGYFGKRKYGNEERVLSDEKEGYDVLRFREVRTGNLAQRTLQSLLDGGAHEYQRLGHRRRIVRNTSISDRRILKHHRQPPYGFFINRRFIGRLFIRISR